MPTKGQQPSPTTATDGRYLVPAEVAERLRTSIATIVRLCREGKIPATKPAGTWLIPEAELEAHIAARRNDRDAA